MLRLASGVLALQKLMANPEDFPNGSGCVCLRREGGLIV